MEKTKKWLVDVGKRHNNYCMSKEVFQIYLEFLTLMKDGTAVGQREVP